MTYKYIGRFLTTAFVMSALMASQAQTVDAPMSVEANVGLREYLGDQGSSLFFAKKPDYQGAGINFGYYLSPTFDGVVNFSAGDVGYKREVSWQTEPWKYQSFRANTMDLTLGARFKLNSFFNEDSKVIPYLYGGFGGYYVHSQVRWGNQNEIQNAITEMGAAVQGGAGVSFNLSDRIGLRWSWTATYTMNDRWDGANQPGDADPFMPLINRLWKTNDMWGYHAIGITMALGESKGPRRCKDKDEDGVCDKYDLCKKTPEKYRKYVDSVGCPADRDLDSIYDADDACPDVKGLKQFAGCPDTDGDGIEDSKDKCPKDAGSAETGGCPDRDGDGVLDKDDKCPTVAGLLALNGCPDRDGDGVEDDSDKCPDVPGAIAGEGCPDTDGDGIYDNIDKCPTKPGIAANKGCPEMKVATIKAIEKAAKNIFFETNKDILKKESFDDIDILVKILRDYSEASVIIEGHTDSDGDPVRNLDLSQRRADAVVVYMLNKGISPERMKALGFGDTRPKVPNTSVLNKATNRRVEILVTY